MTKILHFPHKERKMEFGASSSENQYPGRDSGLISADSTTPNLTSGSTPSVEEEMCVKLMAAIWPLDIPIIEKAVLVALADYVNKDDVDSCYPGLESLSLKCRLSKRQLLRHLKTLEKKGFLRRKFRSNHSTIYVINTCLHSDIEGKKLTFDVTRNLKESGGDGCSPRKCKKHHKDCTAFPPNWWESVGKAKRKKS